MNDADRYRLIFGPYSPPEFRLGGKLTCESRQRDVVIHSISDGFIQWPRSRTGLVLCGDLVRAVKSESEIAVAHWWGVSIRTVLNWRRALGVGRTTEGTSRLHQDYYPEKQPHLHSDPVAAGKIGGGVRGDQLRGKPASPEKRAALLAAARRSKSPEHREAMSRAHKARAGLPRKPHPRGWKPEEDAILGTASDRSIAGRLNRTIPAVRMRRRELGIPPFVGT